MPTAIDEARTVIEAILCAGVLVSPLDSGLTHEEIKDVAIATGVGRGTFNDAWGQAVDDFSRADERFSASERCWRDLTLQGFASASEEIRPAQAMKELAAVFDALDSEIGATVPKALDVVRARMHPRSAAETDRAIGVLLSWNSSLTRQDGGLIRRGRWGDFTGPVDARAARAAHVAPTIERVLQRVRDVFAKRVGAHAATEPPTTRFQAFAQKRGWSGLVEWWAQTSVEMRSLVGTVHPSAICVLCAALVEASLVAVAPAARAKGEWKQKFLNEPPATWKFGDLIAQAEAAGTLTPPEAQLAKHLADLRNRIHAGRHAEGGGATFKPPYSNAHDASQARNHVDTLLAAILEWAGTKL